MSGWSDDISLLRWFMVGAISLFVGSLSLCAAGRIYKLENKEPEVVTKEVPKYIQLPCPSPSPCPVWTPVPQPAFDVRTVEQKWKSEGDFLVSHQIDIPADGEWYNSKIQAKPGFRLVWNYEEGYTGGLSVRIGNLEYTQYRPLDYKKAYYAHSFVRRRDYQRSEDEVILETPTDVEFRALESNLTIRLELWKQ